VPVIGVGKIARDQHLPAIAANPAYELVATVSRQNPELSVPWFADLDGLLASGLAVDAVALCTPPQVRYALAVKALQHKLHVFLEKPPGATLAEVESLRAMADEAGVTLFASWHSRYAAGVEPAKAWLAERAIRDVKIIWREDVRVWFPIRKGIIRRTVDHFSMSSDTGRKQGEEDRSSFIRKGIAGDWKNHFTPETARVFNELAGDMLIKLGYEQDDSWVERFTQEYEQHTRTAETSTA